MKLVVDSSVIVSAIRPDERFHGESLNFLERVKGRGDELWVPMTMFWEIGTALSHTGKVPSGTKFNKTFNVGELKFIPIDQGLFQRTWLFQNCCNSTENAAAAKRHNTTMNPPPL